MKSRIIVLAVLLLKTAWVFAQLTPGVYIAEEQNCARKREKIQLAVFQVAENYYEAELRITASTNSPTQLFAISYWGGYTNGELILNKGQTREIKEEKLTASNYEPGEQQMATYFSAFAYNQLKLVPITGTKELRILQVNRTSTCSYPTLRYDAALTELHKGMNAAIQQKINNGPRSFFSAKTDNEKAFILYHWGQKLLQEYPNTSFDDLRDATSTTYLRKKYLYKLFRDDQFSPFFETPIGQLDEKKKQQIINELLELRRTPPKITKNNNFRYLLTWQDDLLKAALTTCSGTGYGVCERNVNQAVSDAKNVKVRYGEILNMLSVSNSLTLAQLNSIKVEIEKMEPGLWPSESNLLLKKHHDKEGPIAEAELLHQVSKLVTAYNDYANLQALEQAPSLELFNKVSPGIRDQQLLKIKQAQEKMLQQLVQAEMQSIQKIKSSADPFAASLKWYQDFQTKYGQSYANNSTVQQALKLYQDQRLVLLTSNKLKILAEIKQTTSAAALSQVDNKYMRPGLKGAPVYDELLEAFNTQQASIDFKTKKIMGGYTYEQILAIENKLTDSGEPTEEQMKLATLKIFYNATKRFENMANSKSDFYRWLGQENLMTQYKLTHFEKLGCVKATNRPGYICDCNMAVKTERGDQYGVITDFFMTLAGADSPHVVTHRYIKSEKYGWINLGEVKN